MTAEETVLKSDEKAVYALRALYEKHGYRRFKMSKFEEYDLYQRNKDFLVSDGIITFNDTDGRLMALKPDVTLSIVKNSQDAAGVLEKVCYNESVYRVGGSARTYREITQVGLECIGDTDAYSKTEVLELAVRSLETISDDTVLELSHLGFLDGMTESIADSGVRREIVACLGAKNRHELRRVCAEAKVPEERTAALETMISFYRRPDAEAFAQLRKLCFCDKMTAAVEELEQICSLLTAAGEAESLRIDFSVVNDMSYYSGLIFQGFVNGIPDSVLSGGEYDGLMRKMGRSSGAIGFAVYPGTLERLSRATKKYDIDTLLLYAESNAPEDVMRAVKMLTEPGKSVLAEKSVPANMSFRQILKMNERGIEILETND